jgi:hypothetical protein
MNADDAQRGDDQPDEQPQAKPSYIWAPELSFTDEERQRYAAAAREVEAILAKQKRRRRRR